MTETNVHEIFKVNKDKLNVVCPPKQVFLKSDFDFLLTIGGSLVGNAKEFENFKFLLKSIGETEFYVLENIGATVTEREIPFKATISLESEYDEFQKIVSSFDAPFGWSINHFFVYGCLDNWGIYICEYPTVNIIGCEKVLSDKFRKVFSIDGNGYIELEEFLNKEFQDRPDLKKQFLNEYKLQR